LVAGSLDGAGRKIWEGSFGNRKYGHLPKGGGKEGRGRDGEGDLLRGRRRGGQGNGVIVGLIPAPALRVDE
jgi:hypothetical protein